MTPSGLEARKAKLALCMRRLDRAATTHHISVEAGMHRSHTSAALNDMKRRGEATARRSDTRGGGVLWSLTERGRALAQEAPAGKIEWRYDHRALWSVMRMGMINAEGR